VKPIGGWFKRDETQKLFYFEGRELLDLLATEVCGDSISRFKTD